MSTPVLDLAHSLIDGLKQGAGDNWIGCCPIHGEVQGKSKPSFSFHVATGQWHCFSGCGGGSLRSLLKKTGRSGESIDLTMKRLDRFLTKVSKKKTVIKPGLFMAKYALPERILGLFEHCPEELLDAGFDEDVLWDHDVGFDQERGWITYPIRDIDGQLAGLVGRTNDPQTKYKVYTYELEKMGFRGYEISKSDYFWRWDIVYPQTFFAEEPPVIHIVEGFKAALWLVQNGYENTIATMGTSLSDVQRVFLERLGGTIVWCLDFDPAGQKMVGKNGKKVKGARQLVMTYPDTRRRLQPDDLSPEELHEAIESSLTYSRWMARRRRRAARWQKQ